MIEKYYDTIHKSENFAILAYYFENYVCNDYIDEFKNKMFVSQEEDNDCFDEEPYDSEESLEISFLKNLTLALLMALMPLWMMLTEMNLL